MSDSGIGFGGFLLGLGLGWYVFRYFDIGFEAFSYLLILLGVGIILGALLSQGRRRHPISGIYGGIIGGLFLAAFLTQGFGFITDITDEFSDFPSDYRATETFTENTPLTADSVNLDIDSVNGGIEVSSWLIISHVSFGLRTICLTRSMIFFICSTIICIYSLLHEME